VREPAPPAALTLDGRVVPVRLRRNRRARRIVLRLDPDNDGVVVTLPPRTAEREAMELVVEKSAWVLTRLDRLPPRRPFADGAAVPVLGVEHRIRHRPEARGGAWIEDGELHVSGTAEHVARRVADWLQAEARRAIAPRVHAHAETLGKRPGRIAVRDTRSRWGSCSRDGNLSFSWRLVMTPESVLDYVVAHEVAHLEHMNHGARFWRTVAVLGVDVGHGRAWLRRHGDELLRYG
jgi:predicted metal-dependent hydrolase